ncbi:TetR family transcriptional regulator [Georgenia halophila]|uniref:TetR family transcriptional regulator n=1 Tax=Georgenia halophila TaxID=620889 RepID=A0ABP8LPH0_9MICO
MSGGAGMGGRGAQRREDLERAGVALLAKGGWPAVTARGVAERAGTNAGLIHYHYGGLPELHRAVAVRATDVALRPLVERLVATDDVAAAVLGLLGAESDAPEDEGRLTSELVAGAMRDEAVRAVVGDALRQVRTDLETWLAAVEPSWTRSQRTGTAVALTALLDGLYLHRLVDDQIDLVATADALAMLLRRPGPANG